MSLKSFFSPKSVAIVGASRQKGKVGYEILVNMLSAGFAGKVFGCLVREGAMLVW